jgi:hypothetical protein
MAAGHDLDRSQSGSRNARTSRRQKKDSFRTAGIRATLTTETPMLKEFTEGRRDRWRHATLAEASESVAPSEWGISAPIPI